MREGAAKGQRTERTKDLVHVSRGDGGAKGLGRLQDGRAVGLRDVEQHPVHVLPCVCPSPTSNPTDPVPAGPYMYMYMYMYMYIYIYILSRRASHQAAALVALGHAHVLAHGSTRFALGVLVFWVSAMTQNMPHAHTHTLLPCIHHSRDSHDNAHTPRGGNQQPSAARGRRRHGAGSEWPHTS
jgi:hypothetical protein